MWSKFWGWLHFEFFYKKQRKLFQINFTIFSLHEREYLLEAKFHPAVKAVVESSVYVLIIGFDVSVSGDDILSVSNSTSNKSTSNNPVEVVDGNVSATQVEVDASDFAVGAVLLQDQGSGF